MKLKQKNVAGLEDLLTASASAAVAMVIKVINFKLSLSFKELNCKCVYIELHNTFYLGPQPALLGLEP